MSSPSTQQMMRLCSESTTPRTNLTARVFKQSNANSTTMNGGGDEIERTFSYSSVAMLEAERRDQLLLEPPAWKPPEQEEIEYTDAWNSAYGSYQSHFLQPFHAKDDSTIGSNQTNNSLFAHTSHSSRGGLRPRGFSICSNGDSIEISSQSHLPPQPSHRRFPSLPGSSKRPQPGHRRHPSLPQNIFSSQPAMQHPLLPPTIVSTQTTNQRRPYSPSHHEVNHQTRPRDQAMKLLQSSTQHAPYEIHSSHHTSQVQADAALAGLTGTFIDLYAVDRSVDTAAAIMQATKEDDRERKTALGTMQDIQCILELYRIDKMADRFKVDLQMPLFMEEEAWVHDVYKDLRRIDIEMKLYSRRMNATERNAAGLAVEKRNDVEQREESHFDLSDSDDESLSGEEIFMKAESFLSDDDPYNFFDPHETSALRSNKCQTTEICSSINDDLRDVIELLKTDVEIDGASRRHAEMEMLRPLIETDQEMNKLKESAALQELWTDELKALYAVDLEVDRAKTRDTSKPAEAGMSDITKTERHATSSQEVKEALARHIPNVSQPCCPTSPEVINVNVSSAPPPAPMTSPETSRRSIFAPQQKNEPVKPADSAPKRSIFSQKEKASAVNAQRGGVMVPGATVVLTKGGEMIDDIPIGKVRFPDS